MSIVKELPKNKRVFRYVILAIFVIVCVLGSYLCFSKQNGNPNFDWLSTLLLNIAIGIAITAIFIYVSEERLRRYRLKEALSNLRKLIHNVYFSIERMGVGSQEGKQNQFHYFLNCSQGVKFDNDIIESERPKLYKEIENFNMCYIEYKMEVLKQCNYTLTKTGEIFDIEFINGINVDSNIIMFINNLRESCNKLNDLLGLFN